MHERSEAVLRYLRENSRMTLAAMARKEGVAISTIFDHVRKLERDVIDRHVTLMDYPSLGYPFRTFFYCQPKDTTSLLRTLKEHGNSNNVFRLSNDRIGAEMIFASLQEEEAVNELLEEACKDVQRHRTIEPVLHEGWTLDTTISGTHRSDSGTSR